jgi:hypothetical protein
MDAPAVCACCAGALAVHEGPLLNKGNMPLIRAWQTALHSQENNTQQDGACFLHNTRDMLRYGRVPERWP